MEKWLESLSGMPFYKLSLQDGTIAAAALIGTSEEDPEVGLFHILQGSGVQMAKVVELEWRLITEMLPLPEQVKSGLLLTLAHAPRMSEAHQAAVRSAAKYPRKTSFGSSTTSEGE